MDVTAKFRLVCVTGENPLGKRGDRVEPKTDSQYTHAPSFPDYTICTYLLIVYTTLTSTKMLLPAS